MDPLAPFLPTSLDPWGPAHATHLALRAGFGAQPSELARLVDLGPAGAADALVDFPAEDPELEEAVADQGDAFRRRAGDVAGAATERLRGAWLFRMVRSAHPLREQLALFWHDHFAVQESKVIRFTLLERHLGLLREACGGRFPDLLKGVAADPAMLVHLDNRLNVAGNPNENWARELMELHCLGVDRYSQRDVVELARVFTGWTTPAVHMAKYLFRPETHDTGDKELLGKTLRGRAGEAGRQEGEEAIDHLLTRPEAAPFLAEKLLQWFADLAPAPEVIARFAEVLREVDWHVGEALRVLFRSAWFHAPERRRALYKNPIVHVVSAMRLAGVQNPHRFGLPLTVRRMGMDLFEPPQVDGWVHGPAWASSGAVVARLDFAQRLAGLAHAGRKVSGRAALDLDALVGVPAGDAAGANVPDAGAITDALIERLLQRPLAPARRGLVVRLLENAAKGLPASLPPARRARAQARTGLRVVTSLNEFGLS